MKQHAHILYFVPDLVTGQRFALGAWLVTPDRTHFVAAAHQPGQMCLGGAEQERLAKRLLERVESVKEVSAREVALRLGQFAQLSPALEIPADVRSAERWLGDHVLPQPPREAQPRTVRRRDTAGLQFLRSREVDHFVRQRFDALAHWNQAGTVPWIRQARATHWVDGGERLLLLEPIVVRDDRTELNGILSRLMALDMSLQALGVRDAHRVAAYVLPGGALAKRHAVLDELRHGSCEVWDAAQPREADALVGSVREVAALQPSFALA